MLFHLYLLFLQGKWYSTHFQPMFHFYAPLKTSENLWYRNGALVENGLNHVPWVKSFPMKGHYLILNLESVALNRLMQLKSESSFFIVRRFVHMTFQNIVIGSFQITINNYYDIWFNKFQSYQLFLFFHFFVSLLHMHLHLAPVRFWSDFY